MLVEGNEKRGEDAGRRGRASSCRPRRCRTTRTSRLGASIPISAISGVSGGEALGENARRVPGRRRRRRRRSRPSLARASAAVGSRISAPSPRRPSVATRVLRGWHPRPVTTSARAAPEILDDRTVIETSLRRGRGGTGRVLRAPRIPRPDRGPAASGRGILVDDLEGAVCASSGRSAAACGNGDSRGRSAPCPAAPRSSARRKPDVRVEVGAARPVDRPRQHVHGGVGGFGIRRGRSERRKPFPPCRRVARILRCVHGREIDT